MPALIDLRRRIKSVRNTQQITMAMKNVASAKLKKTQRVLLGGRPYWHTYPGFLSDVAFWAERESHPLLVKRAEKRIEGVVVTSDKGLCGAFNSSLLERAFAFFQNKAHYSKVRLVLIGKKAVTFFQKHSFPVDRAYHDQTHELVGENLDELAQFLMRLYGLNRTDSVYVAYNEFKSILAPRITIAKLLPVEPKEVTDAGVPDKSQEGFFPDWEPGSENILKMLLPLYVKDQIHHFIFESSTAEHAARMMAMDSATKNAGDFIDELILVLNKIRQGSITKELLEIMSAVEALAEK